MIQPIIMRIDLIFNFNAEKLCKEMALEGKLNSNKHIHFLITPVKDICIYERLLFQLFIVTANDKKVTIENEI